jgi:hypothetical protein
MPRNPRSSIFGHWQIGPVLFRRPLFNPPQAIADHPGIEFYPGVAKDWPQVAEQLRRAAEAALPTAIYLWPC